MQMCTYEPPKFTNAARCTFGNHPLQSPKTPLCLASTWNAWNVPWYLKKDNNTFCTIIIVFSLHCTLPLSYGLRFLMRET